MVIYDGKRARRGLIYVVVSDVCCCYCQFEIQGIGLGHKARKYCQKKMGNLRLGPEKNGQFPLFNCVQIPFSNCVLIQKDIEKTSQ